MCLGPRGKMASITQARWCLCCKNYLEALLCQALRADMPGWAQVALPFSFLASPPLTGLTLGHSVDRVQGCINCLDRDLLYERLGDTF